MIRFLTSILVVITLFSVVSSANASTYDMVEIQEQVEVMKNEINNYDMSGVVNMMRSRGYDSVRYHYWVRNDGCKMLGPYIMLAANLNHFPRGSIVECSLGWGIVCDTGYLGYNQLDIAVSW